MTHNEIWAITDDRITAFLSSFPPELWQAEKLEERKVGQFSFPQTRVIISDDELHRKFVLNFISAGG